MVLQAGNPLVGGTMLRRAMMQSPNYSLAGKTGWTVNQDGSAVFFSITAEGTITATEFAGNDFVFDSDGLFFYDGPPGNGNLYMTVSIVGGTDPYGNVYLPGVATYSASGHAQILGDQTIYGDNYGNYWTWSTLLQATSGDPLYLALKGPGGNYVSYYDANGIQHANEPGNPGVVESWHVPSLTGGWNQASGLTIQYMLMPSGMVALAGRIKAGTVSAGTTVMTLPAGYYPRNGTISLKTRNVSGNGEVQFSLNTSGLIQYQAGAASGDTVDLDVLFAISMTN